MHGLRNHLRCFGFLFQSHAVVHFAIGFFMTIFMGDQPFYRALLAGFLVVLLSGFLNLLTYFWRHRFTPHQLLEHHLNNFFHAYPQQKNYNPQTMQRDLKCLLYAPYLSGNQRQQVQSLYQQLHLQPLPVWQVRYQLEQLRRP